MSIRVLVVDDSGFFRRRVSDIINADGRMEVVGVAENGQQAVDLNDQLKPDVITMDYEMPVMDGITAVRVIMDKAPVPILMFSSLTFEGARITLDALDAGALDFLSKNFDEVAQGSRRITRALTNKIAAIAKQPSQSKPQEVPPAPLLKYQAPKSKIDLVMIGTSTGGPAALQTMFKAISGQLPVPVVIVQHMPESFTRAFAERLDSMCDLSVKEAEEGDRLQPGHVYVAPGGMQLIVDKRQGGSIHIHESDARVNYRPSVDIAFASAAKHFGKSTLAIVMTGMGSDGCEGAKLLKSEGANVWAQDEQSCVIFGMPMAIVKADLADNILPLNDIGPRLQSVLV